MRLIALIALLTSLAFAPRLQPLDGVAIDPHGGARADVGCAIDPNGCPGTNADTGSCIDPMGSPCAQQQSSADRGLGMDPNG